MEVKFCIVHAMLVLRHFRFFKKMDTLYDMEQEGFKMREQGETEGNEKEVEYHFKEIQELEKPLVLVLEKLRSNIEAGIYDVLLSDDIGGRITTLTLREIINKVNWKAGRENVLVYFLSAGHVLTSARSDTKGSMKKYIEERIKDKIRQRALVVTEYVATGKSVQELADILEAAGVTSFDVAALIVNGDDLELGKGRQFFSGITPKNAEENGLNAGKSLLPSIYKNHSISGVRKTEDAPYPELHPALKKPSQEEDRDQRDLQKRREIRREVNEAREDVKTLANNAEKALGW